MDVKILHAADFHLDSPFQSLPREKAVQRRGEQRALLGEIAALANREGVQLMLLAGDLFDSAVSYFETGAALMELFSSVSAQVVIAPGNHDYFAPGSPWATMTLPDNVHIFKTPALTGFDFPQLGCRVWGAGFTSALCPSLLRNFNVIDSGRTELMVLHGDLNGGNYNPITPEQIAASGLDYMALGHVHSFSGFLKAGDTVYAYPGCPEGRGFDETGEKGVILGTVGRRKAELGFVPVAKRRYEIITADVTGSDPQTALLAAADKARADDVVRFVLTGEYEGRVDTEALERQLNDRFFMAQVRSRVTLPMDIWQGMEENSLRGLYLKNLRNRYDAAADDSQRSQILTALKYGLAALDKREEWSPR